MTLSTLPTTVAPRLGSTGEGVPGCEPRHLERPAMTPNQPMGAKDGAVLISVKGKLVSVPCVQVLGRTLQLTGRWPRWATFHDEEWQESGRVENPLEYVDLLRRNPVVPDILAFAEPQLEREPRFTCRVEWDNAAVVPISTFADWWERRVPQETRKNVRRSQRRGVEVRQVVLDAQLAAGIKRIYDETPVRQGRRFWHFGKPVHQVLAENASYAERSEFIGAFFQGELIGFLKVVFVGGVGRIMQILSMNAHFDKRPTNALLAQGVERCCVRGASWFVYGKYVYPGNEDSAVTEFKRRNGFEEYRFPRYHLPLTRFGQVVLRLNLHKGWRGLIPDSAMSRLRSIRSRLYRHGHESSAPGDSAEATREN